jgi:hypothetical protein
VSQRVFIDIDPGYGQMWQSLGLTEMFRDHDQFVTIGQNIGRPDCTIPTCGLNWIATSQPVLLDLWPRAVAPPARGFTSIASWRGPYGPVEFNGQTYGPRVHEFRKLLQLPQLCDQPFELALDIHPNDQSDRDRLLENGWRLVEPGIVAGDPQSYREFIRAPWQNSWWPRECT